ncbi:trace amine-associated receptor 4-like [Gouania willdenowi]|uniref:trace amine-associated receptor 4-like n=1 Tax=Gouania willdenowi TaxID=441366 RepID=UPI0010564915|nr:trace amine-associated receptor 4-like [Gouania willdenowi]
MASSSSDEAELCFPHLNSSCRRIVRSSSVSVLIHVSLSSVSVLTVFLNLLVIIAISHFRKLHTPANLLLLSLAVSDFFVGTIILISVDRYVAVCEPLQYPTKVTADRVKICVSLCWVICVFFHTLILKENLELPGRYNSCLGECVVVVSYVGGIVDVSVSFIGPVTVITIMSLRVFVVAVSHAHSMRSHVAAAQVSQFATNKSELKAFRTVSVVVVVFIVCITPYFCVTIVGGDAVLSASSIAFVMFLFFLNSFLNPLIYALCYPWFRMSIKLIVTFQIINAGSSEANVLQRE